ncbi:MAG TPA: CopD family protein, partial [Steroidobacteraceae bacterium]
MLSPDGLAFALRALGLVTLFSAAGAAFFLLIFRDILRASETIARLAMIAAVVAAVCCIAQQSMEAARFAGEWSGITQRDLLLLAWNSPGGFSQVVRVAGLAVLVVGLRSKYAHRLAIASVGAVLALLSFLLSGHTSIHPLRPVLTPLLAIHVIIGAFWFGSLLPLWLISRHEPLDRVVSVLRKFSSIAGVTVPLIFVAGLATFWILGNGFSVLVSNYGQAVVFGKICPVLFLAILAASNRWYYVPRMAAGNEIAAIGLRRAIIGEIVIIAIILAVTAGLTLFLSPET